VNGTVRTLPQDARLDNFWTPFGPDDFELVRETITLERGTLCIDLADKWEVCSGPWDGIRFLKWQT
jgi:hypothetical protein